MAIHGDHSLIGTNITVHDSQQCRLPDPAPAHNGNKLSGFEIEREVMQPVMAVLKCKINITSGQMNDLLVFVFIKNSKQVTVIDRQEQRPFQHTAMLPGIKHIRRKRNIIHKYLPVPMIGENMLVEATDIEHTDEPFHPFPRDMVDLRLLLSADRQQRQRSLPCDKGKRIVKFFLRDRKNISYQAEQSQMLIRLLTVRIGKLHETDQQKQLFFGSQLYFHLFAYIPNNLLFVQYKERIVIHIAQCVVKFNILFMGTYPEVAGEIRMNGTTCLLPFNPHGGSENSK